MASVSAWEAFFMLVVLKLPMVYLAVVIWWAIRAEPRSAGGGPEGARAFVPLTPCGWDEWRRSRPRRRGGRGPVGRGGGIRRPVPRASSGSGAGLRPAGAVAGRGRA
jgi:hypothetical protein